MTMTATCVLLWCLIGVQASDPTPAQLAERFEKQAKALENVSFRCFYQSWQGTPPAWERRIETEVAIADVRLMIRTIHFDHPNVSDARSAAMYDQRFNTVYHLPDRWVVLRETVGTAVIDKADHDGERRLAEPHFLDTAAVRPAWVKGRLDARYDLVTPTNRRYELKHRDYWLAEALRLPGWKTRQARLEQIPATGSGFEFAPGPALVLERTITGKLRDEIWLSVNDGYALAVRKIRDDDKPVLYHVYRDFREIAPEVVLPHAVEYTARDGHATLATLHDLKLAKVGAEAFTYEFAPGMMIEDRIASTTRIMPGGLSYLGKMLQRLQQTYAPADAAPSLMNWLATQIWFRVGVAFAGFALGWILVRIVMSLGTFRRPRHEQPALSAVGPESSPNA